MASNTYIIPSISTVASPTFEEIENTYVPSVAITPSTPASADTVVQGGTITFTGTVVNGQPGGTDTFNWQYSSNGGNTWSPLTGAPGVSQTAPVTVQTTKTGTLTISNAQVSWNGYLIMVTATDPDGVVSSNVITLGVVGTPVLTKPVSQNVMIDGTHQNVNDGSLLGWEANGPRVGSGDTNAIPNVPLTVNAVTNTTGSVTFQWCTGTATPAPTSLAPCNGNAVANALGAGATTATFQPDVVDNAGVGGPTTYYACGYRHLEEEEEEEEEEEGIRKTRRPPTR